MRRAAIRFGAKFRKEFLDAVSVLTIHTQIKQILQIKKKKLKKLGI